jgi:hypothetical protein
MLINATKAALIALLISACVSLANAQESRQAKLAWKFAAGDVFGVEFEQEQTVLTRIEERDRTLESLLILGVDWKVLNVADNGDATIEQTIKRIRIKTGTVGAELKKVIDVDTASEDRLRGISRDAMKQIKPLIGLKFKLVMSPQGRVIELAAGEKVANVIAELPETSAIRNAFSPESLLRIIEDSSVVLSAKELNEGDTWEDVAEATMKANDGRTYSFERKTVSSLDSMSDTAAKIGVSVLMTPAENAQVSSGTELTSPMEVLGFDSSGSITFDRQSGTVTSSTLESELKTRVMYRTDQINTTLNTKSKTTVARIKPDTGK